MGDPSPNQEWARSQACLQVVEALAECPDWQPLREALEKGQAWVNWVVADPMTTAEIICQEGHGAHHLNGEEGSTSFHSYLNRVIQPMIQRGDLQDGSRPGSFDDRKLRWSDTRPGQMVTADGRVVTLEVGPTCYPHCQSDIHRKPLDALDLMLAGLQTYNDPYAYFARGMGVVVIPLSHSGQAWLGKRINSSDYADSYCFVSGWATFTAKVHEINFTADLERELQEEIHYPHPIQPDQLRFAGLSGQPLTGEVDLVFILQTDLADAYFDAGSWPEHQGWQAIGNRNEAQRLLEEGRLEGCDGRISLMFSSRSGLEFLIQNHWTS